MVDKPPIIYLDNNATTELSQENASIIIDIVSMNIYGNPSSSHSLGTRTRALVNASRFGVAQSLGCSSDEIIFTSGGTESNNLAIRGTASQGLPGSVEFVVSGAEHPSVRNTVLSIAGKDNVRFIPLLPNGTLDLEWAERLITEDTSLVSVMLANNETGVIFPIKEIVKIAHSKGVLVHCDAVQAYGKIPVKVRDLGVDLLSISGHKVHALPGIGALYVRKGVQLHPHAVGGGQEHNLRAGTENYIGIASLGTSANEIHDAKGYLDCGLRDAFEMGISRRVPDVVINGKEVDRIPNTSSITFKGIHSASLMTALSEHGLHVSAGPACSSGTTKPSKTLLAMDVSEEDAKSTIRFSFSKMSKMIDAALAIEACVVCVKLLRKSSEAVDTEK